MKILCLLNMINRPDGIHYARQLLTQNQMPQKCGSKNLEILQMDLRREIDKAINTLRARIFH